MDIAERVLRVLFFPQFSVLNYASLFFLSNSAVAVKRSSYWASEDLQEQRCYRQGSGCFCSLQAASLRPIRSGAAVVTRGRVHPFSLPTATMTPTLFSPLSLPMRSCVKAARRSQSSGDCPSRVEYRTAQRSSVRRYKKSKAAVLPELRPVRGGLKTERAPSHHVILTTCSGVESVFLALEQGGCGSSCGQ